MTRRLILDGLEWLVVQLLRLSDWIAVFSLRPERHFACVDCGADTLRLGEYYMVWRDVWAAAGPDCDDGMLCIGCLEARLGRRLSTLDFTDASINFNRGGRVRARVLGLEDVSS
jgi:hypothetical protein